MASSLRSFGFEYEVNGRNFAFHVYAESTDEARAAVKAMAQANLIGELFEDRSQEALETSA